MEKILGIGPFIGSFEQEILAFRPYARWITEVSCDHKIFLNTHYNRLFLYNFIDKENLIPVNRDVSKDEFKLKGYVNKDIDVRDFNFLVRSFKDVIARKTGSNKKNIDIEHINYTKRVKPISIDKKIFEPIDDPDIDIPKEHKNRIIVIPHKIENIKRMKEVIEGVEDPLIIGDWSSTNFQDHNVLSRIRDYRENIYKYMIKYINYAKVVICPISFWTAICNLQNVPVVSWGKFVSPYKNDGIYSFGNDKSMVFVSDKNVSSKNILNMFKYFMLEKMK